jgi:Spy/CpxP family protein refolding chaperone
MTEKFQLNGNVKTRERRKIMKRTALAVGFLVLSVCVYGTPWAREPRPPREERGERREEMKETIQIWRLHKMREVMELTREQSDKVLQLEEERNRREGELWERARQAAREIEESLDRGAPDGELKRRVDAVLALQGERGEIRKEFQDEMRKILNVRQQAQYVLFEMRFKKKVREMMARARAERFGEHDAPRKHPRPHGEEFKEDFDF